MRTIFLLENPNGKTTGRPRHRWKYNTRMNLRKKVWEVVDWIHLAQDRDQWWALMNTVMKLRVP
jgi:hypothetical protein